MNVMDEMDAKNDDEGSEQAGGKAIGEATEEGTEEAAQVAAQMATEVVAEESAQSLFLGSLKKGNRGVIRSVRTSEYQERLREIGFLEGSSFEIVHEAPLGGDPFTIRVRGALIALRRSEADQIEVEPIAREIRKQNTKEN